MSENMDCQNAYRSKLRESAKLLSETTMHLIGSIIEKHDCAIIEVGLEMRKQIKDLHQQNDIMHDALMRIAGLSQTNYTPGMIAKDAIDSVRSLELGCQEPDK